MAPLTALLQLTAPLSLAELDCDVALNTSRRGQGSERAGGPARADGISWTRTSCLEGLVVEDDIVA